MKVSSRGLGRLQYRPLLMVAFLASVGTQPRPLSAAAGADQAPGVLDIGSRRQVFIDRRFLEKSRNVELVVHPPVKTGEMTLVADRPWESGVGIYNSVLEENGTYHMWYEGGVGTCYARSKDGITWEKPALGLTEYQGDRRNNIVIGHSAAGTEAVAEGGMVFIDPNAPPEQRFRMTLKMIEPPFVDLYSSPDGVHWKRTHEKILSFSPPDGKPQHLDTQNVIIWDDRINRYVAYMRRNVRVDGPRFRTVSRSESPVLGGFQEAQAAPIVIAPDDQDAKVGPHVLVDYYTNGVIKYPWAQDAYYMFPAVYFHFVPGVMAEFPKEVPRNAGTLHTQFAAGRDGVHWERFDRRPFVRLGLKGAFDDKGARIMYGVVPSRDGREMYMYYIGTSHAHGWERDERNKQLLTAAGLQAGDGPEAISRLVLRRDGFVSARAAYAGGEFTTEPLKFSGRELVLNVDTSATGMLRCELQDETGRPLPGHSLDDCDLIHNANEINRQVRWKGRSDVSSLVGRPVRLRVVYRDTDLYAFQFR
ncbi:MAG: hypothetical protein HRF43_15075 [Phycisphaerae bacterium]|jgi:hypothetical protein